MKVLVVILLAAAGLLSGGTYGAYAYLHDYDLYRGFPPPSEPASIPHGRLEHASFYSRALGQRRSYLVYLPPGYARQAAAGRRFGVLYLLHAPVGKARNSCRRVTWTCAWTSSCTGARSARSSP